MEFNLGTVYGKEKAKVELKAEKPKIEHKEDKIATRQCSLKRKKWV